jgi:hypothetical protein
LPAGCSCWHHNVRLCTQGTALLKFIHVSLYDLGHMQICLFTSCLTEVRLCEPQRYRAYSKAQANTCQNTNARCRNLRPRMQDAAYPAPLDYRGIAKMATVAVRAVVDRAIRFASRSLLQLVFLAGAQQCGTPWPKLTLNLPGRRAGQGRDPIVLA